MMMLLQWDKIFICLCQQLEESWKSMLGSATSVIVFKAIFTGNSIIICRASTQQPKNSESKIADSFFSSNQCSAKVAFISPRFRLVPIVSSIKPSHQDIEEKKYRYSWGLFPMITLAKEIILSLSVFPVASQDLKNFLLSFFGQ